MHEKSIVELRASLDAREISAVELAQHFLSRIEKSKKLNAFVDINIDSTLKAARVADQRIANGSAGPLTGIPIVHKDVFVTRDWRSTAGSKMLEHYKSPFDATVVKRLSEAGAVCLGKTNMDEFAMGSSNENSYFGAVKNPWDQSAVPGGSSGGSAAAIAARLAIAATASDTGGSIRQPASLSGVTGIKPTYGSVSRYGMIAFASSLDQAGPIAKSAEDCALILNAMAGYDPADSTSAIRSVTNYNQYIGKTWKSDTTKSKPLENLKIGIPKEYFSEGLSEDVRMAIEDALKVYELLGAKRIEISLPKTNLSIPVYYIIASAEASSNLSRFDGVRYGYRAKNYDDLNDMYKKTRAEGFGDEVKRRILMGTYVLSHGYYDAYYLQAQKVRRIIAQDFQQAFTQCDVLMGPVSPVIAWNIGEKNNDPLALYLSDIYTLSVNLAGLPGISVPCGFGIKNRPIGLQIIGHYFEEPRLLQIADTFQKATDWHTQTPGEYK